MRIHVCHPSDTRHVHVNLLLRESDPTEAAEADADDRTVLSTVTVERCPSRQSPAGRVIIATTMITIWCMRHKQHNDNHKRQLLYQHRKDTTRPQGPTQCTRRDSAALCC
eukprot:194340-Chlamydomonas_euryale.AAC.1